MRGHLRFALPAIVAGATLSSASVGCGSADCTETATCSDGPGDGSPADERSSTSEVGVSAVTDAQDAADDAGEAGSGSCNPSAPDCSNPQCQQAFTCTAAPPAGWFGPIALFDQAGGPPAPKPLDCSGSYTDDAFDGNANPTSPAASCECTCGSVVGACSDPVIGVYPDNQCVAANRCGQAGATTCTVADGPSCSMGGQSAQVSSLPAPTGAGSCNPGVAQNGLPSPGWQRTGRGCGSSRALAAGGCGASEVCADKPPSSFGASLCVWQNADTDCSSAQGYGLLHKYYSGVVDTRGCALGSCGCASPTSVTCSLTGVTWYTATDCSTGGTALGDFTLGHCTVVSNDVIYGITAGVSISGQCTGSGSASSTGSITADPSTAVTVCCSQ